MSGWCTGWLVTNAGTSRPDLPRSARGEISAELWLPDASAASGVGGNHIGGPNGGSHEPQGDGRDGDKDQAHAASSRVSGKDLHESNGVDDDRTRVQDPHCQPVVDVLVDPRRRVAAFAMCSTVSYS